MTRTRPMISTGLLAAALAGLALSGCERTMVRYPLETNYAADDAAADGDFWSRLATQSAVSNDEALHGLLITADGTDPATSYEGRVNEGKKREWLPQDFAEPADMAMQRGNMAVAICRMDKIEGGLTMRVLGPTPRYATRELVYIGLIQGTSSEMQSMSGLEYIAILSKAQDYQAAQAEIARNNGLSEPGHAGRLTDPEQPSMAKPDAPAPSGTPANP